MDRRGAAEVEARSTLGQVAVVECQENVRLVRIRLRATSPSWILLGVPRPGLRDRAAMPLVATMLVTSLVLAGVLAFQAQEAVRDHRAAAERVIHDYAALAADTFVAEAEARLAYDVVYRLLGVMNRTEDAAPMQALPSDDDFVETVQDPRQAALVRSRFRLDLRDGDVAATPSTPEAMRTWLHHHLSPQAREQPPDMGQPRFVHATLDGTERVFVYSIPSRSPRKSSTALGFEVDLSAARPYLERVFRERPLLPPSLTRGDVRNESVFIRLMDGNGRELFQSPGRFDPEMGTVRVAGEGEASDHLLRGARVQASIDGAAAPKLIIGGLPRSRLPLLLALLVLTVGLVAVATLLTARERSLSRLRTDFVTGVSHELRTPITQIRMFSETLLLDRVRSDEERLRSLRIIDQEARRLGHLVENVMLFSKGERGRLVLAKRPLRLGPFLADTVEAFVPMAASRGVTVRIEAAADAEMEADEEALRQVLLNLLDNGLKYGPAGQSLVLGASPADRVVRLWVDDEGPGIPEPDRERVWHRYVRLRRDQDGPIAGAGIGLAVVRELVELHGGRVRAETGARGGARILIELPRDGGASRGERP
jgi:signal transduction histidine kinase